MGSLRKQPTFRVATTGIPVKWRLQERAQEFHRTDDKSDVKTKLWNSQFYTNSKSADTIRHRNYHAASVYWATGGELEQEPFEHVSRSRLYILGDPGADKGDEGKSKRAEKYDTKKSKERREEPLGTMSYQTSSNGRRRSGFWLVPENLCLDFPSSPLSASGSPRMSFHIVWLCCKHIF